MIGVADVRGELTRHAQFPTEPATSLHAPAEQLDVPPEQPEMGTDTLADPPSETPSQVLPLEMQVRAAEKKSLERALLITKQNRSLAARILGVSRSTLYAKLKEHDLL